MHIEHFALLTDRSTDPFGWDFVIGLIVIGLAVAVWAVGRSPKARRSVGRATGRAAIGTVRATGRPIRALGRRSRSGLIGHWGRGVVGCENRAMKAAAAGKHDRARFLRAMGDAMIGSSRIACHVPGCSWEQDPPRLPDVVAHLRTHRDKHQVTGPGPETAPDTNSGGRLVTTTTKENTMEQAVTAETIPELAHLLDTQLIPAAQREVDAAESSAVRVSNIASSMQSGTENMSAMGMPAQTLTTLENAVEAATQAVLTAETAKVRLMEARDLLTTARQQIRAQEAVAETAQAAGGAMDRQAYAG